MAAVADSFDLEALGLSPGEGRRVELEVLVESLTLGGERYAAAPERAPVVLDVARVGSGYTLRLRLDAGLEGPCVRCLEAARLEQRIDAREVHHGRTEDPELVSPYVSGGVLDLRSWVRDALALALPEQIVCRQECLGLCATCGQDLNVAPEHAHEAPVDPRWAKLSELRL